MARSPARSLFAAFGTAAVLFSTGCFDTSSNNVTSGEYPTILTIDPALFRGWLPCGAPGLDSYVATVTDVSDLTKPEVFPSTPPVACRAIVSYGEPKVQVGHLYTGAIDGYDRAGIEPESAGSRTMVDAVTREVVRPRWTTSCGERGVGFDAGDIDAAPPTLRAPQDDAGADADAAAPPFNALRAPTQVIWKEEVVLRSCYPLADVLGPDASIGDAGGGDDAPLDAETPRDASIDQEPPDGGPSGEDVESDTADDSMTEDGAAQG